MDQWGDKLWRPNVACHPSFEIHKTVDWIFIYLFFVFVCFLHADEHYLSFPFFLKPILCSYKNVTAWEALRQAFLCMVVFVLWLNIVENLIMRVSNLLEVHINKLSYSVKIKMTKKKHWFLEDWALDECVTFPLFGSLCLFKGGSGKDSLNMIFFFFLHSACILQLVNFHCFLL